MSHPAARRSRAPRRLLAALLALVTGLLLLGPGAGAATGARVVSPAVFDRDVVAAAGALARYGTALRGIERPDELRAARPVLDRQVRAFDRRIARLRAYRLEDRGLDRRRAALARTGPPVADALHRFNAAAAGEDLVAMRRLVPVLQRRIVAFLRAAGG